MRTIDNETSSLEMHPGVFIIFQTDEHGVVQQVVVTAEQLAGILESRK